MSANNRISILYSNTTPTIPDDFLYTGEVAYTNATGDSDGGQRIFIGTGTAGQISTGTAILGGPYYTNMMDHPRGNVVPLSAIITDANNKINLLNVDDITIDGNDITSTSGSVTLNGFDDTINVSNNRVINVADPTQDQDAVNRRFLRAETINVRGDNAVSQLSAFNPNREFHLIGGFNLNNVLSANNGTIDVQFNLDSSVQDLAFLNVDNVNIDGNTISTTSGDLVLDPTPVGASGKVVIQGDLQVEGTTTTVNSTTLTINDKNIVLADGAANAAAADSAGITVDGAMAKIFYDAPTDTWNFNKDVKAPNLNVNGSVTVNGQIIGQYEGFDSDFNAKSTTDLSEGNNLYYTQARFDSAFTDKSTSDLSEGSNLYYTAARADLAARSALVAVDAGGDGSFTYDSATGKFTYTGPSATEVRSHFAAHGDLSYDSATGVFSIDVETEYTKANFDSDLAAATTDGLPEGSTNLYYTDARADSAARHAVSAAGDLSYDPATGVFQFDVEQVYTKANFDSDLDEALASGTGITYDASNNTINITNTGVTAGTYGSASQVPVFTVNSQGQLDSAGVVTVAGVSGTSIDSSTGDYTINTADGGSFTTRLYDANILNNDGNKAGITWTVGGATDQYRTATNFIDSDLEEYTIREMLFTSGKLRIEVAQFSPVLTATGQTNLNFDQKATQFSVSVDNPSDFLTRYINSVSGIAETDAYVGTVLGDYVAGSKSATPAGGVDWTQVFTFDSDAGAAVRDNSTTINGGTSIGEITFADDQGADFGTTASFTTTWRTPNVSISMSNLSGNQFLETYSSTSYTVGVTGMSSASNYTHTVSPTGGSVSNTAGSGTFTFTTPIHKDNGGGRTLALSTELRRPAGVATTTYAVTDTASDTTLSASFTYPSLTIFTAGSGTPPTQADVVNVDQFESAVTELSNQTKTFTGTVNNSDSVPKCFWFMVRSAASQPTTFQTGASSSLLSDVTVTTGTLNLEPDAPPSGYVAESYNLYGITLQPGNTYVSIS